MSEKKLRILHIAPEFTPDVGGVGKYIEILAKEFSKWEVEFIIICPGERNQFQKDNRMKNVFVYRIKTWFSLAGTRISPMILIFSLILKPDIIHGHIPTPFNAEIAVFISKVLRKPLIITFHNSIVINGKFKPLIHIYNRFILPITLQLSNRILVADYRLKKYLPFFIQSNKKVSVIPIGVDINWFKPDFSASTRGKKDFKVFFLGVQSKSHRYKGISELIIASSKSLSYLDDFNYLLTVAGSGSEQRKYRDLANRCGLIEGKNVKFPGYVPERALPSLYKSHDVFILPSLSKDQEGFGIVAVEAMACGIPVIISDAVGVSRFRKINQCGVVVRPISIKNLSEAIVYLAINKEKRKKMGINARRFAKDYFSSSAFASKIYSIYKILSNSR